jgi:uncharacterized protein YutE (UPF0331/DUF86 family)
VIVIKDVILQKFIQGNIYIEALKTIYDNHSIDEVIKKLSLQLQIERSLEVVIQIIIDVCSKITSKLSLVGDTYADCIELIYNKEIIDENLKNNLIKAIKLRNLISHQYAKINHKILFNSIPELVSDFDDFRRTILDWIDND